MLDQNMCDPEVICDSSHEYSDLENSSAHAPIANVCVPFSEAFETTLIDTPPVQIVFGTIYSFIWIFSITSNTLILFVAIVALLGRRHGSLDSGHRFVVATWRRKTGEINIQHIVHPRSAASFSVRTIFVICLASSDLLTALTSLPITAFNIFTHQWLLGQFMCKAIGFMQAFAIFQSSFTFSFIAFDRYLVVAYPDVEIITYKTARLAMGFMAITAAVLATPMYIFVDTVQEDLICGEFCVESWPDPSTLGLPFHPQRFYSIFILALQFGLPTFVTTVCYILIASRLKQRHQRRLSSWCQSTSEKRLNARRRRMNRMMSVMVFGFVLAWSPFNTLSLLRDFDLFPYLFDTKSFSVLFAASHLVAMTTLVLNPIIYAWFNRWIRDSIFRMFTRCRTRGRRICALYKIQYAS